MIVNGEHVGRTPVQHIIRKNDEAAIIIKKNGYRPETTSTYTDISAVSVLEIIGGVFLLVAFIGLWAPGAWHQGPSNMTVVLEPENQQDQAR